MHRTSGAELLQREPRRRRASDFVETPLSPRAVGTLLFLIGLVATAATIGGDTPSAVARHGAIGLGVSLAIMFLVETRRTWRNLLRADLVAMGALYYLLFLEFLIPQPMFDVLALYVDIEFTCIVALVAFGAMAIGRHFVGKHVRPWSLIDRPPSRRSMLALFWMCFAGGYFYMLASSGFNPLAMVYHFMGPRFSQPWTRGQYGDLSSLLFETGAVIYLVPPLAGVILGRARLYPRSSRIFVLCGYLFTLFFGFSSGTRGVLAVYLASFIVAYYYASGASLKRIVVLGGAGVFIMLMATVYGLAFRNIGLRAYLAGQNTASVETGFFVDYNLLTISRLVQVFPANVPYVGLSVPAWVVVRIVPRALWPGKPDGSVVSPETYVDPEGASTLSCTFVGEAYMGGGLIGVIIAGLILGWLPAWWTRKSLSSRSEFGVLIYGSGFFAVVTTMRSLYMLPVALLPTIAVAVMGYMLRRRLVRQAVRPTPVGGRAKSDESLTDSPSGVLR